MTGAGTKACSVYLTNPTTTKVVVTLSSDNPAVRVPASVTLAVGASHTGFTTTVASVSSTQTANVTGNSIGISKVFVLQLNPAMATLSINPGSIPFGNVTVNTTTSQSLTLTSTGTTPVTINAAALTGTGFTIAGTAFPVTLNSGSAVTLNVQFNPTTSGATTGQLTVTSNDSTSPTAVIGLSGTGMTALSAVSCSSASITGSGTDACTVTLNGVAPVGGSGINLTSSSPTVVVPTWAVVPANATSAGFTANVSSTTATQTVTLTAKFNGFSKLLVLQLNPPAPVPVAVVTVTPTNATTITGATQQFSASVTGISNTSVTWTVAGPGCSGTVCGTVSSSGFYTAPTSVPSPANATITARSQQDTTKFAVAAVTIAPAPAQVPSGKTYYLAPMGDGGNDSNSGLTAITPWLSPNHSVNCGDVLLAAAGDYDSANFWNAQWGHVTCAAKNDVAWLKCATFDTCKISSTARAAMFISAGYWGVQGWEVTTPSGGNTCINIAPAYWGPSGTTQIDHIILANNVVSRCDGDGIGSGNGSGTAVGTDYVAYLGNIAYDTGHAFCAAGLSFWAPVASDTVAGTHYYMAGNFAWDNHSTCGDAEGIILDTLDGVEAGRTPKPYDQQVVAVNNMVMWNDGPGMQVDLNMNGTPNSHSHVYMIHNTLVNNGVGPSTANYCAQLVVGTTVNAETYGNLSATYQDHCFGGSITTSWAEAAAYAPSSTNSIHNEYVYSSYGHAVGSIASAGVVIGPNISSNPMFVNPSKPGAPNCTGKTSVPDCLSAVIADFTPTESTALSYGYQMPSSVSVNDPLYPQWLCTVTHLPNGLVTPGCGTAPPQ